MTIVSPKVGNIGAKGKQEMDNLVIETPKSSQNLEETDDKHKKPIR